VACAPVTTAVAVANNVVTALSDSARTAPGGSVTIPVIANDTSASGQALNPAISLVTYPLPSQGTAVARNDGTVSFTAARGFVGTASYQYQVCDTSVGAGPFCSQATVTTVVTSSLLASTGTPGIAPIIACAFLALLAGIGIANFRRRGHSASRGPN
ncbi:MAG: Ig-like domain-containing protein, partial [Actinomycetota bacterium]|nr:Ig-like domain-containing protein [Actinomycetota bacterium]